MFRADSESFREDIRRDPNILPEKPDLVSAQQRTLMQKTMRDDSVELAEVRDDRYFGSALRALANEDADESDVLQPAQDVCIRSLERRPTLAHRGSALTRHFPGSL